MGGPDDALLHYEAALELLAMDEVPAADGRDGQQDRVDRVALAVKACEAALAAGRVHRAFRLVQRELVALPQSEGPVQRARLLHATANAALLTDTGMDVLELTTEALALLEPEEVTPLRARLANTHALASLDRYRDDEAVRWLDVATDLGRQLGLADVVADAAVTRSYIERRAGDPDGSREALQTTIAAAHGAGEVAAEIRSIFGLANLHFDLGELAEARRTYEQAHRLARDRGRRWAPYGVDARIMAGIVAYTAGDWADALQICDTSNEDAPPLAKAALATIGLAVAAGRGDTAALDQVPRVRLQWQHDALVALLSAMAAIDLYGDSGDLATAEAVHDEVVDVVSEMWDRSTFQARIRMSALLIGQLTRSARADGDRERLVAARRGPGRRRPEGRARRTAPRSARRRGTGLAGADGGRAGPAALGERGRRPGRAGPAGALGGGGHRLRAVRERLRAGPVPDPPGRRPARGGRHLRRGPPPAARTDLGARARAPSRCWTRSGPSGRPAVRRRARRSRSRR